MKLSHILAALSLVAASSAFAGGDHTPLHDGVFSAGKPMDTSKATAKLTLLVGADKQEVN